MESPNLRQVSSFVQRNFRKEFTLIFTSTGVRPKRVSLHPTLPYTLLLIYNKPIIYKSLNVNDMSQSITTILLR